MLSLLRGAYDLSKVVTLGPESSQSRLGQNTHIATERNRARTRPAACLARFEGFGFDRC